MAVDESFETLSKIATKNKADNRVNSPVRACHVTGNKHVQQETTRKMSKTAPIL